MIVCLRVDERLIHGQVAMTWTKELKLNGLVVASDEAASNELQKMTLKMAVPEGIKCIIKSVEDVTTILDDPRSESIDVYKRQSSIHFYQNPQDHRHNRDIVFPV